MNRDQTNIERAPERFNFARHVVELNKGRASKVAYIDDQGTLTYSELATAAARFALVLLRMGIRREERVLLAMHDGRDWPVCFLGCLHAGVVPMAVSTMLNASDYAWMLRSSGARAILTSQPLVATLLAARKEAAIAPIPIIASTIDAQTVPFDILCLSKMLAPGAAIERESLDLGTMIESSADTHCDDIAFWLYSSGSTGRPKATVHSHGNLFATNATYGRHVLQVREDDVTFSAAKLFFAYGLGNSLTFPLCAGATAILMSERPTSDAVFKRIVDRKPTVFFGVPTLYANMLATSTAPEPSQMHLRLCISAGEALPADLGERFTARYGAPILDGIGSTEMLHIFLSNSCDALRYGTSGRPVPGYEVKLLGEDDLPVADGEIGDLYVRGESQTLMYWCNREKSRTTFLGEWMRTGDKYQKNVEGWYVYAGRSDDMLKISGQYVSPFEVESALIQHPAVLEAALIGVADGNGLTKGKTFVVLKPGTAASEALASELQAYLKERLTPHKVPKFIEFVSELPKTPTGKIQRFKLREREGRAT